VRVGSPAILAFFAHTVFWGLIVYGWAVKVLTPAQMMTMLGLWIAGLVGIARIPYLPVQGMFPSYVAVLDIALVLMIAGGDVR
jgi:hypothetical protein